MKSSRIEAFSDGVLAIIITIMILELKVPESYQLESLLAVLPKLLAYLLSYAYVAIYWNNHHHLLSSITKNQCQSPLGEYDLALLYVPNPFFNSLAQPFL